MNVIKLIKVVYLTFILIFSVNLSIIYAEDNRKDQNLINIESKTISSNSKYMRINLRYPNVEMPYNKEAEGSINTYINDYIRKVEAAAYDIKLRADKNKSSSNYYCMTDYTVTYNKDNLLSFVLVYTDYTGGINNMQINESFNFDLDTGKRLLISDLFNDNKKNEMMEIVNTNINNGFKNKDNTSYVPSELGDKLKYYLGNTYIKVYFDMYEYSNYKNLIPTFKLPYSFFDQNLKYETLKSSEYRYNDEDILNILKETAEYQNGNISFICDKLKYSINDTDSEIEMIYSAAKFIYDSFNSAYITSDEIETFIYHVYGKNLNVNDIFNNDGLKSFKSQKLRRVNSIYFFYTPVEEDSLIVTVLEEDNNDDGTFNLYGIITDNSMLYDVLNSIDSKEQNLYGYKLKYKINKNSALGYNIISYNWKQIDYKDMILNEIKKES